MAFVITKAQVERLEEMLDKNYPIHSLRFQPMEGHITVGVRVSRGLKYFFIGQRGQLKGRG